MRIGPYHTPWPIKGLRRAAILSKKELCACKLLYVCDLNVICDLYLFCSFRMPNKSSYTTPAEFYADLRHRIELKISLIGDCWEWTGYKKAPDFKYGKISITFMGVNQKVGAHRASYMGFNETFNLTDDISHICHNKVCVNPNHLSHEPHEINMERERCKEKGVCKRHGCYNSCIFSR